MLPAAAAARVAAAQVGRQVGIALPDQALAPVVGGARLQLLREPDHHPQQEAPAIPVAGDAAGLAVLPPQPLAGLDQVVVHPGGHLHVLGAAAHLQHPRLAARRAAGSRAPRSPRRRSDRPGCPPAPAGPPSMRRQGLAQVPVAEAAGGGGGVGVHVVLQHQPLGLGHRRLGLVQVGAGGQRQQPGDPPQHGVGLGPRRPWPARRRAGRWPTHRCRSAGRSPRSWGRGRSGRGCPAPRRRTGGRSRASAPRAPRPRAAPAPAAGTATACAARRATAPAAPRCPAAPAPAAAAGRRSGSG